MRLVVISALLVLPALGCKTDSGTTTKTLSDDAGGTDGQMPIVQHFKYGSIGSEPANGIPYWIWRVLPDLFPDLLPKTGHTGYAALGFIVEDGSDVPIGFSKRKVSGLDFVGLNCAACHTGTVRETATSAPMVIPAMPSHTVNLTAYFQFLFNCAADPRFTVANFISAIQSETTLTFVESGLYAGAVPQVRQALKDKAAKLAFLAQATAAGPGRVDTFTPYKALQFGQTDYSGEVMANADFPSIWNQQPREGMHLHWDGNNTSVHERNISASIGAGVTPESIDLPAIKRVEDWLWTLTAPAYPFAVDQTRADAGKTVFAANCAGCHAFPADLPSSTAGTVQPIEAIGTDRARLDSFTTDFAAKMDTIGIGYPWRFTHFTKTSGYANVPLDGVWTRGPFLHNGSVPSLRDLLTAPAGRPAKFYRGCDVYDQTRVGFLSRQEELPGALTQYFLYDTTLQGNGNGGHDYGTALPDADKDALVEYMKTI